MHQIDVRDLLANPGSSTSVTVGEAVPGLRLALVAVPDDAPITGDLLLESVIEGILVSGTITGRMTLSCARCLKEFEQDFDVKVEEMYVRDPGPDDDYGLTPELTLDPEPMVRDAVVLSMPFAPLCEPDCLGLCERCGGDRNLGECTCTTPPADLRWAGLETLIR